MLKFTMSSLKNMRLNLKGRLMKILFATGNDKKAKRFSKGLLEREIEVISLKDIDRNNDKIIIQEDESNVVEFIANSVLYNK